MRRFIAYVLTVAGLALIIGFFAFIFTGPQAVTIPAFFGALALIGAWFLSEALEEYLRYEFPKRKPKKDTDY